MIAFASNSLLCRLALKQTAIDPATFTFVRVFSGAVALWLVINTRRASLNDSGNWPSALALFVYAAGFSFAYVGLAAGTGALLLFGAVQATMILWGFHKGERLNVIQVLGLAIALVGLVVLVFPGLSAPPLVGSMLMLGYAIISGAITSGLGYVIWYSALSGLKATSAAAVQLSVPVLAAAGGILLLGEAITLRYVFASVAVLGGIALVIWERDSR